MGVFVGVGISVGGAVVSVIKGSMFVAVGAGASVGCAEEQAETSRISNKVRVVLC